MIGINKGILRASNKLVTISKNKTAIITGGAQGFGLDIAKTFLFSGAKVFIWDIDKSELSKAVKEIDNKNLDFNVVDVSKFEQVKDAVDKISANNKIDILVNSAGITGPTAELWNYDNKAWDDIININLHGTFYCCKLIVPIMIKNNYGRCNWFNKIFRKRISNIQYSCKCRNSCWG